MKQTGTLKKNIAKRLLRYIKPYKGYVVGAFVFSILYVGFVLVGPVLYGYAIDAMLGEGKVDFSQVYRMVGGFALCVLLAALAQKLLGNCVNSLCYKLVRDLRREAFYSMSSARVKYVDTHAQGDVMSRVVNDVDIISDGIVAGSVQIPSSGKPIIMMADRQTTGGYAKIATVITSDLPLLAQLRPGGSLRFEKVDLQYAVKRIKQDNKLLKKLQYKILRADTSISGS